MKRLLFEIFDIENFRILQSQFLCRMISISEKKGGKNLVFNHVEIC